MNLSIRWKGENISSSEVENVILKAGEVSECIVYGLPVEGNEGKMGVAVIVTNKPSMETIQEIVTLCSKNLNPAGKPKFIGKFIN